MRHRRRLIAGSHAAHNPVANEIAGLGRDSTNSTSSGTVDLQRGTQADTMLSAKTAQRGQFLPGTVDPVADRHRQLIRQTPVDKALLPICYGPIFHYLYLLFQQQEA